MTWQTPPPESKAAKVWLDFHDNNEVKYFLLEGAVRSTKTYGSILAWCDEIENNCPHGPVAMMGNTRDTLIRNVITPMQDLLPAKYIQLNRGTSTLNLFGRQIHLIGAPNLLAIKKLQGAGFVRVYCDEAETYPKDVWQMLGTRTDAQGMKIIATFNPGSPAHYLKREYMDRLSEVNGKHWHFTLDDNPFMPEARKRELKAQYTGLWYKRYILGLWVVAEGAIFDMFSESKNVIHDVDLPSQFSQIITGVDYGTSNPSSFINLGLAADGPFAGKWIVFKEYFFDSREANRQKTDREYSDDMRKFQSQPPNSIEVDPSAASFKVQLEHDGFNMVMDADNTVLDGIRDVSQGFSSQNLLIHDSCIHLIDSILGYVWDPKAQAKGEDKPLKQDDHPVDALRYAYRRVVLGLPISPGWGVSRLHGKRT